MTYTISTDKTVPVSLCESDEVLSVLQNVALICSTKQGTCVGYREFGLPMKYIGKPLEAAETLAAAEINDAVALYESRATVTDIEFTATDYSKMKISVEVEV